MTVYKPDERMYVPPILMGQLPWSAVGRVAINDPTGGGNTETCTGTLVGPNLVLTASHCLPWDAIQGTHIPAGRINFLPASYTNVEQKWLDIFPDWLDFIPPVLSPLPSAVRAYAYLEIGGDGDLIPEGLFASAFDMAVLVLDQDLSESHGWLGQKSFKESWAGHSQGDKKWFNIGYDPDSASQLQLQAPVFSGPREVEHTVPSNLAASSIDNAFSFDWFGKTNLALATHIDTLPGHSGGPLIGYFGELDQAFVVGVYSYKDAPKTWMEEWDKTGWNYFAGGHALPDLVAFAHGAESKLAQAGVAAASSPGIADAAAAKATWAANAKSAAAISAQRAAASSSAVKALLAAAARGETTAAANKAAVHAATTTAVAKQLAQGLNSKKALFGAIEKARARRSGSQ